MTRQIRIGFHLIEDALSEPVGVQELAEGRPDKLLLARLIRAARKRAEKETGILIGEQKWRMTMDRFPHGSEEDGDCFLLLHWPIRKITRFAYQDEKERWVGLESGDYRLDDSVCPARIEPPADEDWPQTVQAINAVTIEYLAGEPASASAADAIRMIAAHLYDQRDNIPLIMEGQSFPIPVAALAILQGN